jgi:hypothetical protein
MIAAASTLLRRLSGSSRRQSASTSKFLQGCGVEATRSNEACVPAHLLQMGLVIKRLLLISQNRIYDCPVAVESPDASHRYECEAAPVNPRLS